GIRDYKVTGVQTCALPISGQVLDSSTDPNNCGGCGVVCPSGQSCEAGRCISNCPSGQTRFDGQCTDLSSNRLHCGACGVNCFTRSEERRVGKECRSRVLVD